MRKHEILAAIVEMRFVNCKLCDKAVYSKMNDMDSLACERQKFVDECGSKYPAGDVKTQIRQAFHNGGNIFSYRFRCLFFGLNGLIGALRKFQILPSGCS